MEVLETKALPVRTEHIVTDEELIAEYGFYCSLKILDKMLIEGLINNYEYNKILALTKHTFPSKFLDFFPEIA